MGGIGDMLFGTEDKAYSQNLKNYKDVQAIWQGIKPEQAKIMQAYLSTQSGIEPAIKAAYAKAAKGLKQGAKNASTAITQNQTRQMGAVTEGAVSKGMSGTSVPINLKRAVASDTSTALGEVQSALSKMESDLQLGEASAVAGAKGNMANAYMNQIQQNLALAQGQTGGMTQFQFQGSPGLFQQAFSGVAAGAGAVGGAKLGQAMFSDRRLKQNIVRVGTSDAGVPIYEFEYISEPGVVWVGTIAQEIVDLFPDAVSVDCDKARTMYVDYSLLDIECRKKE